MAVIQNYIQVGEYCHAHRHGTQNGRTHSATEVRFNLSCIYQLPPSAVVGWFESGVLTGVREVPDDIAGGVAWIPRDERRGAGFLVRARCQ